MITTRFYEILFERYPQAKPLFGRNQPRTQQRMLQEALVAVIDHLDDAEWLGATLGGLGRRHDDYGVTPEMYDWVGAALLATLGEIAAEAWNDELEQAWADAYGAIRGLMLAGSVHGTKVAS
jgi:hemoglobin-like flavoprotein